MAANDKLIEAELANYEAPVKQAIEEIRAQKIVERIWDHDYTVWSSSPEEITNRLGWLRIMATMQGNIERIYDLKQAVKDAGYTHVLLLGMGGSSLAPEVFSEIFNDAEDRLWLQILDSTDPGAVIAYDRQLDISRTLFIVSTKSGGTAETLSAFKYFYNQELEISDSAEAAGKHFIAITDPGSKLEDIARNYHFRDTFLNDPNIGGRYSVLSYFGIVPAVLAGVDIKMLLERADKMANGGSNAGAELGAIMGELAKIGRDKITFVASPAISNFGDWVEQLIAESTGKNGKGIVPVVGEPVGTPDKYGNDRLFVHLRLQNDTTYDGQIKALKDAGHPIITIHLGDRYDIGGQFFLWEMATAIAGYRIGIQPFDQPNVEAAKNLARAKINAYLETGQLEELKATLEADGIKVIGDVSATSPGKALQAFLNNAVDGAYISIHAYLTPTEETTGALRALQTKLRDNTKLATTLGYGPRFLHSTGQLHKGDAGKGLFIQFTADIAEDVNIPDEAGRPESGMTFGTLKDAQALGDRQALLDAKRLVIRFHLANAPEGIMSLVQSL